MEGKVLPLKVVVREIKPDERITTTGIIIPEKIRTTPTNMGKVALVGESTPDVPMVVNVGDTVLFTRMAGVRFQHQDEEFILLNQAEVLFMFE